MDRRDAVRAGKRPNVSCRPAPDFRLSTLSAMPRTQEYVTDPNLAVPGRLQSAGLLGRNGKPLHGPEFADHHSGQNERATQPTEQAQLFAEHQPAEESCEYRLQYEYQGC